MIAIVIGLLAAPVSAMPANPPPASSVGEWIAVATVGDETVRISGPTKTECERKRALAVSLVESARLDGIYANLTDCMSVSK